MPKHLTTDDAADFVAADLVGAVNGVAALDGTGKVPSAQLPASTGGTSGVTSLNGMTGDVTLTYTNVQAAPATSMVQVTGLVANGIADDGPVIQQALENIGVSANRPFEVVVEAPPTGIVYINSSVQVQSDNTTLRFRSPVVFGPLGRVRLWGETVETPSTNKPKLTADTSSGAYTIPVDQPGIFAVNDYIVIRGQRDASGNAFQRMTTTVTGISGSTLTLADPLDSAYLIFYPTSAWPGNYTQVTKVVGSLLTANASPGDNNVTVASTSTFAVGDPVQILDNSVTHDSDTVTAQSQNYIHREMATVLEIVSGTVLRLSHEMYHSYVTSQSARVVKIDPVVNSSVEGLNVTWSAMSTVSAAIEMRYAVNSAIRDCVLTGGTYSWLNQAFRQSDTYHCITERCRASAPVDTSSGRGYGATLYGATHSTVTNCRFISLRHSVLLYNGSSGNRISQIHSEDCRISDLDCHGAQATRNVFSNCIIKGGSSIPTDGVARKSACKAGNPSHIEGDVQNTFENITCIDIPGAALEVVSQSTNTVFRNSRAINCNYGIYLVANSDNTALISHNTRVSDVEFEDISTSLVYVDGGSSSVIDGLILDSCRFIRPTTGLNFNNAGRVHVRNCRFYTPSFPSATYAVSAVNCPSINIKGNDFSGCNRGVKLTTCTNSRITNNTMHDLVDTTVLEDAGGNNGILFRNNEIYGFTPFYRTSGTGPSSSGIVAMDSRPYYTDTPADHGFLEWNIPWSAAASGTGQVAASQTLYLMKIEPKSGQPVLNVNLYVGTLGSGLTSGQCLVALFDDTGTRLGISGDQSSNWTSVGLKTISLGSSISLLAGRNYYVAILANGTTPPSFVRGITSVSAPNAGQTNANQWFSTQGTTVTAMPSSLTLSSNAGTGAVAYLVALS